MGITISLRLVTLYTWYSISGWLSDSNRIEMQFLITSHFYALISISEWLYFIFIYHTVSKFVFIYITISYCCYGASPWSNFLFFSNARKYWHRSSLVEPIFSPRRSCFVKGITVAPVINSERPHNSSHSSCLQKRGTSRVRNPHVSRRAWGAFPLLQTLLCLPMFWII